MSKSRVSSHERAAREQADRQSSSKSSAKKFLGLSLSGGKTDKASLALIDYYPEQKKVFLSRLFHSLKPEENFSADAKIIELLHQYENIVEYIGVDNPWQPPVCFQCETNPCVTYETCEKPHIQWLWAHYKKMKAKKKPTKIFTPYTQRCVENYLLTELEEPFHISHAMGANSAPLLARAGFLKRRTSCDWFEVYPPLSVWRIGRHLNIKKSDLRSYKKSAVGEGCRRQILTSLQEHDVVFLYKDDVNTMIQNVHAFDAFICAYTLYLKYTKQTEKRPTDFPGYEDWIEFPKEELDI
jgi:hypothetical protein